MLKANDKEKLEQRVNDVLAELSANAMRIIQSGVPRKQAIDQVVTATVNRLTPESKMLLGSLCNLLEAETLKNELYRDDAVKASYYAMDIRSDFNKRFTFEVPKNVNYDESNKEVARWATSGAVVIVGGVISIAMKSVIPVGIAAIIACVMAVLLRDSTKTSSMSTKDIVEMYLENVKATMLQWFNSIEQYYDEKIAAFEGAL